MIVYAAPSDKNASYQPHPSMSMLISFDHLNFFQEQFINIFPFIMLIIFLLVICLNSFTTFSRHKHALGFS